MKTKIIWTVRHYYSNPRNNQTVNCSTLAEAITELRIMVSDERSGGTSHLLKNGEIIKTRDWFVRGGK